MALHLHTTRESPYSHPAAKPQKRAELWWFGNILGFQRLSPAPSSTRVAFMKLVMRWISRAKDVDSKVPFELSRE